MTTHNWYTLSEAKEYLRMSDRSLRQKMAEGKIKYSKPDGKVRFHQSWLDAYALGYGRKVTPTQKRDVDALGTIMP